MSALLTDNYQLSMMHSYIKEGMHDLAVFELFVRRLPPERNFLVFAGLEEVLSYLETLRFSDLEIQWLKSLKHYDQEFIQYLKGFKFTGDVHAMQEGTVFFENEPVIRITAPLPEAQLAESRIINLVHYQTLIASKAVRSVLVAPDKQLVDFGFRRAHGAEAGVLAARASYVAGFAGTATVLAGMKYGIPLFGTMAHSYVQAHDQEKDAFLSFATNHPGPVTLLVDTFDSLEGIHKILELAPELEKRGVRIGGVRLDSGNLVDLSRQVRKRLDQSKLAYAKQVQIFASGNLDEYKIRDLLAAKAPIHGFGIGTSLTTSDDAPSLDFVYKLQEYKGLPRRKRSSGKATWPGRKQVSRETHPQGRFIQDYLHLETEPALGESLLSPVMKNGKRLQPPSRLEESRRHVQMQLQKLPTSLRLLDPIKERYPVTLSSRLVDLARKWDTQNPSS